MGHCCMSFGIFHFASSLKEKSSSMAATFGIWLLLELFSENLSWKEIMFAMNCSCCKVTSYSRDQQLRLVFFYIQYFLTQTWSSGVFFDTLNVLSSVRFKPDWLVMQWPPGCSSGGRSLPVEHAGQHDCETDGDRTRQPDGLLGLLD